MPTRRAPRCSLTVRPRFVITHLAAVAGIWLALALGAAPPALAHGGDRRDVRVSGSCGRGASSKLRLRAKDGAIRVEFEVKGHRGGERWRVVLVHERRVAWRGQARTRSGSRTFRIRRSIPDFEGVDQVTARASGPRGNTCEATGLLTGS
jgi:hypothetical protein